MSRRRRPHPARGARRAAGAAALGAYAGALVTVGWTQRVTEPAATPPGEVDDSSVGAGVERLDLDATATFSAATGADAVLEAPRTVPPPPPPPSVAVTTTVRALAIEPSAAPPAAPPPIAGSVPATSVDPNASVAPTTAAVSTTTVPPPTTVAPTTTVPPTTTVSTSES